MCNSIGGRQNQQNLHSDSKDRPPAPHLSPSICYFIRSGTKPTASHSPSVLCVCVQDNTRSTPSAAPVQERRPTAARGGIVLIVHTAPSTPYINPNSHSLLARPLKYTSSTFRSERSLAHPNAHCTCTPCHSPHTLPHTSHLSHLIPYILHLTSYILHVCAQRPSSVPPPCSTG